MVYYYLEKTTHKASSLFAMQDKILDKNSELKNSASLRRGELALVYWRSNKSCFGVLAEAARAYLSAPCMIVDREHLFN